MPRNSLKIKTKGKSYGVKESPLYKIGTKKRLSDVLGKPLRNLNSLRIDAGNYEEFIDTSNGGKPRHIQKPSHSLDEVHTRIASLLCRIQTPEYLHSGKKGCSNVTNASVHLDSKNTLTTDVKSFFPSTSRSMVFSFFYSFLNCRADVADILADICTCHNHVPTGSRISMPLAYWSNAKMFDELQKLSNLHNVKMTVYVDDLTFSGDKVNKLFCSCVGKIVRKYGHLIHPEKTKLYKSNQPKLVTGVVVHGKRLKVRNAQHHALSSEFSQWTSIKDSIDVKNLPITKKLLGRVYSMSVVDNRFRSKASTIKASMSK